MQTETEETLAPIVAEDVGVQGETAEELQLVIAEAQKKLAKAQEKEDEEEVERVVLPLADVLLKIEKNTIFEKRNVTPPELMILCAMHHANAKDNPAQKVSPVPETKDEVFKSMKPNPLKNGRMEEVGEIRAVATGKVKTITVDPRVFKALLSQRYKPENVDKLFPGVSPKFPTKFRQAITGGVGLDMPNVRMFDMPLAAGTA